MKKLLKTIYIYIWKGGYGLNILLSKILPQGGVCV